MKRRLLALLLVLAMLLPMIPMGTMAEEGTADEAANLQAEDLNLSVTAFMTPFGMDGVEVDVTGTLPASEAFPVYLVAAYFDWSTGKMADSAYVEVTDGSSETNTLHLYDTPEYGDIRVFALDSSLQPLVSNDVSATWKEEGGFNSLDGQEPEETVEETEVPEETVETVPEETEETVPEETKETVPEVTEETAPVQEELTPEEAAEEGYYVAPEGAVLREDASVEEMAAFIGTDKASKGVHIASFTGLVPQQIYTFLVSGTPGSLDDLKYIWIAVSDANGNLSFTYLPKDEGAAIVQLYGPEELTLTAEQDYVTLQPGKTVQLRLVSNGAVEVYPDYDEAIEEALNIYVDEYDNTLFTISIRDDFQEKLQQVETRYIQFYGYADGQSATTKVRVDLIPADSQVEGATLGETAVTHNYYSSEATAIPVFLEINTPDQESTVATQAAFDAAENTGFIRDVAFSDGTPEDVKNAFEIRVQDDHTLLLSTKETMVNDADGGNINLGSIAKSLKGSYTNVGFRLTVVENGQEKQIPVTGTLKLTVQKKLPTLKANTVTLNTYAQPTGIVTITGGEVAALKCEGTNLVALVYNEENGTVTAQLRESTTKSSTVNLTAEVAVVGYNQPVTVKVPVKIDAKAPTFKLEKTSLNLCSIEDVQEEIPVLCTTKGINVEDMEFDSVRIEDSKGKELDGYNASIEGGKLHLESYAGTRFVGKQNLVIKTSIVAGYYQASEEEWDTIETPVSFKLTVNNVEPTLKLDKRSLIMNIQVAAGVFLKAKVTGIPEDLDYIVGYYFTGDTVGEVDDYFEGPWNPVDNPNSLPVWNGEGLLLQPNTSKMWEREDYETFINDTYTVRVGIMGTDEDKWDKITVKLTDDILEENKPSFTLKSTGTIDLNDDDSRVTLVPTYKGNFSAASLTVRVVGPDGNTYYVDGDQKAPWDAKISFSRTMNGDNVLLGRKIGEEDLLPGTYTATAELYGQSGDTPITTATTTFKVVKNKPTIKVTGKLDSAKPGSGINIYSSYRHYDADGNIQDPEISLASSGKKSFFVDKDLYYYWTDENGNTELYPSTYQENLIPAGKYTLILTYGDGGETGYTQTTSINITQTAGTLKLGKTSVTLHPQSSQKDFYLTSSYTYYTEFSGVELYQANGKTPLNEEDPELFQVEFDPQNYVALHLTGEVPEKDTTIKVKLIPDTRMLSKFSWLTVKVLGDKSLNKKLTLKARNSLDPSYDYTYTSIAVTASGFDNKYFGNGTVSLLESTDKGKTYHEVDKDAYKESSSAYSSSAFLGVSDCWKEVGGVFQRVNTLNPNYKYRVEVSYGENLTGTADLKVAYGKNKFTVAKAPTLYKKDYQAEMDIHVDQQDMGQLIDHIDLKPGTGFTIKKAAGKNNWTIQYTGSQAKLKTTTLSLQIFLKGNETTKPNATMSLKVTVK